MASIKEKVPTKSLEASRKFTHMRGAQQYASKHGFLVVAPDTAQVSIMIGSIVSLLMISVDVVILKWKTNYRLFSYVTKELPSLVAANFKVESDKAGIMGHRYEAIFEDYVYIMGGHGALICALKNPGQYKSVSAFAPICNPVNCPWGVKAFSGYLGEGNKDAWKDYDACELAKKYNGPPLEIMVDQGKADNFLTQGQLLPDNLVSACAEGGVPIIMRMQEGYDHSYYFMATFMADHFDHHAKFLKA
ncbi:S-formylglutathione hydrolase-like [Penaeus monodon]|uniref:S-formylglutathione hydrolase-like n=1 Tax=Penaeus monodon TaxID=6687 RepID=UPI0018A6E432|nr:S-formylglutathione hydrolase-like [Penaeus monodon]